MYNPIDISNYFVHKYGAPENDITPMKLVKLVYIAYGWHLGITGKELFSENIEAWKYGPVIPSIYNHYKKWGRNPIGKIKDFSDFLPNDVKSFLDKIWDEYGKYDAIQLSSMTHQKGSPWYIIWNDILKITNHKSGRINASIIPSNLIKLYYQEKLISNKSIPQN